MRTLARYIWPKGDAPKPKNMMEAIFKVYNDSVGIKIVLGLLM